MKHRDDNGITMNKAFAKLFMDGITEQRAKAWDGEDMPGWTFVVSSNPQDKGHSLRSFAESFAAKNWPKPRKIETFKNINPDLSTFSIVNGVSVYRVRMFEGGNPSCRFQIFIERFDG